MQALEIYIKIRNCFTLSLYSMLSRYKLYTIFSTTLNIKHQNNFCQSIYIVNANNITHYNQITTLHRKYNKLQHYNHYQYTYNQNYHHTAHANQHTMHYANQPKQTNQCCNMHTNNFDTSTNAMSARI